MAYALLLQDEDAGQQGIERLENRLTIGDLLLSKKHGPIVAKCEVTGALMHISDVESGIRCACVCMGCSKPLVAKKGKLIEHHFAHKASVDSERCNRPGETALHLLAKEAIFRNQKLLVPSLSITEEGCTCTAFEEQVVEFDRVELEVVAGDMVPDVVGFRDGHSINIEVAVTHFCDEIKTGKIVNSGTSALEIDLSDCREVPLSDLDELVIYRAQRRWLNNRHLTRLRQQLEREKVLIKAKERRSGLRSLVLEILHETYASQNYVFSFDDWIKQYLTSSGFGEDIFEYADDAYQAFIEPVEVLSSMVRGRLFDEITDLCGLPLEIELEKWKVYCKINRMIGLKRVATSFPLNVKNERLRDEHRKKISLIIEKIPSDISHWMNCFNKDLKGVPIVIATQSTIGHAFMCDLLRAAILRLRPDVEKMVDAMERYVGQSAEYISSVRKERVNHNGLNFLISYALEKLGPSYYQWMINDSVRLGIIPYFGVVRGLCPMDLLLAEVDHIYHLRLSLKNKN